MLCFCKCDLKKIHTIITFFFNENMLKNFFGRVSDKFNFFIFRKFKSRKNDIKFIETINLIMCHPKVTIIGI